MNTEPLTTRVIVYPPPTMLTDSQLTADMMRQLPTAERIAAIQSLTPAQAEALLHDWAFWRRTNQRPPDEFTSGQKSTWLVMAGRGYGKTRVGAEQVKEWVKTYRYVNLIGPTADDIRDAMIEGESGILAICSDDERPTYLPSRRQLQWPNGAVSLLFSAEEPDRLRNKQHEKLWCDEFAAWKYFATWDNAQFGLRLGANPQSIVTTTPRPIKEVIELAKAASTVVTRGTTYENRENLSDRFYSQVITKYEGTRLGRQELQAELLEDNPGALFFLSNIEKNRVMSVPVDLERIVVPIDPAATSKEDSDETGIVPVGVDKRVPPHYYVLEDVSLIGSPNEWAKKAVDAYHALRADKIIGEINNGGEMVEACIRNVDNNVAYKAVHATRGKVIRAEPIAGLYEQNRVHHVGNLAKLEDQMCAFNPTTFRPGTDASPDRMDSVVWGLTELSDNYAGQGLVEYYASGMAERDMKKLKEGDVQKALAAKNLGKVETNDQTLKCSKCESPLIAKVSNDFRCQQCGHQWPQRVAAEPNISGARSNLLAKLTGKPN